MNIVKTTEKYEAWLGKRLTLIESDLRLKHEAMRSDVFPFLRATYYRWAQLWADVVPELARAPKVLAVGDLHVENFGTWRDAEGRLVWGINDFDEVWPLPYTNDLLRLATSALISKMTCDAKQGIAATLRGYREALEAGGRPLTLAEHHGVLRLMATARLHAPEKFWDKLSGLPALQETVPGGAFKGIARLMPENGLTWRLVHRVAGLGSLGRQRYVALADWHGGLVAREAKALAPSAAAWAEGRTGSAKIYYQEMLDRAVRCRDPFVAVRQNWIIRRLAPDCSRIELAALPEERDELRLLHAMGWETANVHLGSSKARVLLADLNKRPGGWLLRAAEKMRKAVTSDWQDWSRDSVGKP
jgi:hypothetical protein